MSTTHRTIVKATDEEGNIEFYVYRRELGEEEAVLYAVQEIAKVQSQYAAPLVVTEEDVRGFYEFEIVQGTVTHMR